MTPLPSETEKDPMFLMGCEIMGHCLSFLSPLEVKKFLEIPLSKTFRAAYTKEQYLWKVLCSSDPFYSKIKLPGDHFGYNKHCNYRQLYTSFTICIKDLNKCRNEVAEQGTNKSCLMCRNFDETNNSHLHDESCESGSTCPLHTVQKHMIRFPDVLGIQIMCLRSLALMFENKDVRSLARQSRLADKIFEIMSRFSENAELHVAALHAIVILTRPLGTYEGMMVDSTPPITVICDTPESRRSGMSALLNSMAFFSESAILQAMGCWSMVNIALSPLERNVLVRFGAIDAVLTAMVQYKDDLHVQSRALLALTNLVSSIQKVSNEERKANDEIKEKELVEEEEIINFYIVRVISAAVASIKQFCSNVDVVNRAVVILHNLSLSTEYHKTLLCTPDCQLLLMWIAKSYKHHQFIWQNARVTLHRLFLTLADLKNEKMRIMVVKMNKKREVELAQYLRENYVLGENMGQIYSANIKWLKD